MVLTLEINPDTESILQSEAVATGLPVADLARRWIEDQAARASHPARPVSQQALRDRLVDLAEQCRALPILDHRSADEIIGYDSFGLPSPSPNQ